MPDGGLGRMPGKPEEGGSEAEHEKRGIKILFEMAKMGHRIATGG